MYTPCTDSSIGDAIPEVFPRRRNRAASARHRAALTV